MSFPSDPIIGETKLEAGLVEHVRLDKAQYVNANRTKVVDEGSEDAAFFLGGPGQIVTKEYADNVGASYVDLQSDETADVVHVEVETPNVFPGPPVEGSGKATVPITQADRAAIELGDRTKVSGKSRRRTEGEAVLEGDLKLREGQEHIGGSQYAKPEAGTVDATPTEEDQSGEKAPGSKQASKPEDKSASSSQRSNK